MQVQTPVFLDLAAVSLYIFFVFFFVLVFWLHREGKREGYPLVSDRPDKPLRYPIEGFPGVPPPKTFILPHGGTVVQPNRDERAGVGQHLLAADPFPGAPQIATGDAMRDGVGAASWVARAEDHDLTWDDATPKIVPLRAIPGWGVAAGSPDIRGRAVVGCDGVVAGSVVDLWVDRSEYIFRYVEVELNATLGRAIIPLGMVHWWGNGPVIVDQASGAQIAAAPTIAHPERMTFREEDRVSGYFGGAELHGAPNRAEPLV